MEQMRMTHTLRNTCVLVISSSVYLALTISQLYSANQLNWWRTHGYKEKTCVTHSQTLSHFSSSRFSQLYWWRKNSTWRSY